MKRFVLASENGGIGLDLDEIRIALARAQIIIRNKDLIIERAKEYKEYAESDGASFEETIKKMTVILSGDAGDLEFLLNCAACYNIYNTVHITGDIVLYVNSYSEVAVDSDPLYPVEGSFGGWSESIKEKRLWLDPARWKFLDNLVKTLQEFIVVHTAEPKDCSFGCC